jgi:hypothetical protein
MGLHYNPKIKLDNLGLFYDAMNPKSYPGTGTVITNLMDTGDTGTIVGGPAYTDGAIIHAGSVDYVDGSISSFGTPTKVSVEMYLKPQNIEGRMFFGWNVYDCFVTSNALGFNTGNSDLYGITSARTSALSIQNNWHHFVFVMDDTSYINNKIYIDGNLETLTQEYSTQVTGNVNFNSGSFRYGGWRTGGGYHMDMNFSILRIYTVELTEEEVNNNYAAVRGRY